MTHKLVEQEGSGVHWLIEVPVPALSDTHITELKFLVTLVPAVHWLHV